MGYYRISQRHILGIYMKVFKMQLILCCPRQLLCRSNWITLQTAKKYFLRVIAILTYVMIVVKEIN